MEFPDHWLETSIRLVAAICLASTIGFEREMRDKAAGLRTHMLVGLGSAAFTVFSLHLMESIAGSSDSVSLDPLRIIGAVIGGLGFLGAGAIIQSRGEVYGMTTAAGIWIAGAIGVGCGIGDYFSVALVTVLAGVCLIPIRMLGNKLEIRNAGAVDAAPNGGESKPTTEN